MNYTNGLPKGAVIMWHGSIENIPDGWVTCDGNNGTPDLRRRFIVGAETTSNRRTSDNLTRNNDNDDDYNVEKENGIDKVVLTEAQMPEHQHLNYRFDVHNVGNSGAGSDSNHKYVERYHSYQNYSTKAGGNKPHENRPPYFALFFIKKII